MAQKEGVEIGHPTNTEQEENKQTKSFSTVYPSTSVRKPRAIWLPSQLRLNQMKGITRHGLLRTNRLAGSINHMRKYIIAPNGMQNESNQYVPTLRGVGYEEKWKK